MLEKIRVDKWLWAVRIFKSRSIATEACKSGKIYIQNTPVKASHLISPNVILEVRKNGYRFQFQITKIIDKRVSAPLAAECYLNLTPEEELKKYESWFSGKATPEIRLKGSGRPTKKERRELDEEKESLLDWDDDL